MTVAVLTGVAPSVWLNDPAALGTALEVLADLSQKKG